MPSVLLGQPPASGGQVIISGNVWSGQPVPAGGVQLKYDKNASGYCFVALSGAMTINSGSMQLSGGFLSGKLDGLQLGPGDAYFVPRGAFKVSGSVNIYALHEAAASGQARLFFEIF